MFFKLFLLWLVNTFQHVHLLDKCTLPTGQKGLCVEWNKCPIQTVLQNPPLNIYFNLCGNENDTATSISICCQLMEKIVTPNLNTVEQNCDKYERKQEFDGLQTQNDFSSFLELIIGGVPSHITEFPHMVALGYGNVSNLLWRCAGSLISEQFVLTAAHCVFNELMYGKLQVIRLGDYNLQDSSDDAEAQNFNSMQIFIHPHYNPPVLYNDIALIQLDRPVTITDYVRPACLQLTKYFFQPELIATGWGHSEYADTENHYLQSVTLEGFSNSECMQLYGTASPRQLPYGIIDETQICAGSVTERKDTCQGDSGGPLQIGYGDNPKNYYLIGITSFGKGCGVNVPGVYTRISYFIPWINDVISHHS